MKLQTVVEIEVPDSVCEFQDLESKVRTACFQAGQSLLSQLFVMHEEKAISRDWFLKKDRREKRFETLLGDIVYSRWRVWDRKLKKYVCPIDQWLGCVGRERSSLGYKQACLQSLVVRPYRQAAREMTRQTGVYKTPLSHWRTVQREAENLRAQTQAPQDWHRLSIPAKHPSLKQDPCVVLAMDPDATYCKNQDSEGKNHEVKMAVLYTGKQPENKKKTRWKLTNKQVVFSKQDEPVREFLNRVTQKAVEHYGAHAQTRVVIHGDGDAWIKRLQTRCWPGALYRLDPWHIKKKIILATRLKTIPTPWEQAIYGNPQGLITMIKSWMLKCSAPRSKMRNGLIDLIQYLENNKEGMIPSQVPKEIKQAHPRLFYRGSGTIERNIALGINDRFKQPRMSWSKKGLFNLLALREQYLNNYPQPRYAIKKLVA